MTCIAYDGRMMAADTMGCNGMLKMPIQKLYRTDSFVLGGSGSAHHIQQFFRRVKDMDIAQILELGYPDYDDEKNDPGMIVVGRHAPQHAWYLSGASFMKIERKFHAIGSGRDFALAFMSTGKTAQEAVEQTLQFDSGSGGPVDVVWI